MTNSKQCMKKDTESIFSQLRLLCNVYAIFCQLASRLFSGDLINWRHGNYSRLSYSNVREVGAGLYSNQEAYQRAWECQRRDGINSRPEPV